MHTPHLRYHYCQSKLQLWEEIIRNNMDIICHPKRREHMHLCGNPSSPLSDHAVWTHWDENALCCFESKKHNHHNDPALNKIWESRFCRRIHLWNHPSGWKVVPPASTNTAHPIRGWSNSMYGPVHQGVGIKWTLHCKIPVCIEIKRSRHTERHSCKGQWAASAHIQSVFHQWISNITTKHSGSLVFKANSLPNQISDQRACSALSRHHDRHCPHPFQCGLAHSVGVCVLPMCGRHHRFEAHRAIAAHHGGRGWGRVCCDHQSLGRWERVAAIGKWCCCCCCGLRMAGQWCWAGCCDHRTVAVSCILGLSVPVCAMGSSGEGLTCVSIVASVGVGVIVGFGVVPVTAVVCVGRCQCIVLWGWGVCVESLHWWWSLRRKVILSEISKRGQLLWLEKTPAPLNSAPASCLLGSNSAVPSALWSILASLSWFLVLQQTTLML